MSIHALIYNPINAQEQDFGFPIATENATENVYEQYWLKFAKENNLLWLEMLNGIEIEKVYFDKVKDELLIFQEFLEKK